MVAIDRNVEYLYTRPGIFKLCTVIIGAIALGLGSHGVDDSRYNNSTPTDHLKDESFFVLATSLMLGISLVSLLLHIFVYRVSLNPSNRVGDTVYHIIAGKIVFAAGILLIFSAIEIQETEEMCVNKNQFASKLSCQLFDYKVIGGAFSAANGLLYDFSAFFVYTTKELP